MKLVKRNEIKDNFFKHVIIENQNLYVSLSNDYLEKCDFLQETKTLINSKKISYYEYNFENKKDFFDLLIDFLIKNNINELYVFSDLKLSLFLGEYDLDCKKLNMKLSSKIPVNYDEALILENKEEFYFYLKLFFEMTLKGADFPEYLFFGNSDGNLVFHFHYSKIIYLIAYENDILIRSFIRKFNKT